MWNQTVGCIRRIWRVEREKTLVSGAEEKMLLQCLAGTRNTEKYEMYKKTKEEVKKVVRDTKSKAYGDLKNSN